MHTHARAHGHVHSCMCIGELQQTLPTRGMRARAHTHACIYAAGELQQTLAVHDKQLVDEFAQVLGQVAPFEAD